MRRKRTPYSLNVLGNGRNYIKIFGLNTVKKILHGMQYELMGDAAVNSNRDERQRGNAAVLVQLRNYSERTHKLYSTDNKDFR